jgi:excisionase family DNA binding protein
VQLSENLNKFYVYDFEFRYCFVFRASSFGFTPERSVMENLMNVKQVAFVLKVHPLTVRRYIKEGKLKAVRVGGNVRIKESSLTDFNKDFSNSPSEKQIIKRKLHPAKIFTLEDPLFRLKGRGASLNLSNA